MRYRIHSHRKKKFSQYLSFSLGSEEKPPWSSDCWFTWLINETRSEVTVSIDTAQCSERSVLNGVFDRRLNGARGRYNPQTCLHADLCVDGHRVSVFTAYVRVCIASARCYWHQWREFTEVCVKAGNIRPAVSLANLVVSLAVRNFLCGFGTNVFITVQRVS